MRPALKQMDDLRAQAELEALADQLAAVVGELETFAEDYLE